MTNRLEEEQLQRVVAPMDGEQEAQISGEPEKTLHIHYFPDAIVITPDATLGYEDESGTIVDAAFTVITTKKSETEPLVTATKLTRLDSFIAFVPIGVFLLLVLFSLTFQMWVIFNSPTATITLMPRSQLVTLAGTVQLGRYIAPITLSKSLTVPTTGRGHQNAKAATGFITLYNGQLSSISVPAGTILTAASGIQVVTDQDALIPAATPPTEGQTSITASATMTGSLGNIPAKAIDEACCAVSVLVVNLTPFSGGQNERDFQTVGKHDVANASQPLKTTVTQSMQAALLGQIKPTEQLFFLPCTPTVSSDHQPGQEAMQVHVTVTETCNAIAYSSQTLAEKATSLLSSQAEKMLGTGYSLLGSVQVSVAQASVTHSPIPLVYLAFQAHGRWVYALSQRTQQHIKQLIAGKTKQEAAQILQSQPGIERTAIRFEGFGDEASVPKNSNDIHITLFILKRDYS